MDVALVRWPDERERRDRLARAARPCLLLVAADHPPPALSGCMEDFVLLPAADREVKARVRALSERAVHHGGRPRLDADGVLRLGDAWTTLPPVESRLASALIERLGSVVSRETLARSGWPDGAPGRNALDVHVLRLRRRIDEVGLVIRTVRSRGYLLEVASESSQDRVREA